MDPLEEQLAQLSLLNSRPLSPCVKAPNAQFPQAPGGGGTSNKVAAMISSLQENAHRGHHHHHHHPLQHSPSPLAAVSVEVNADKLKPCALSPKKVGPLVPPKPHKKKPPPHTPEVPQSRLVKPVCEPLYSQRLQSVEPTGLKLPVVCREAPLLQRKQPLYAAQHSLYDKTSKVTLDNPAILEQQLEALAHHKKQLEKKGLLQHQQQSTEVGKLSSIPKLSSTSLIGGPPPRTVTNNSGDYGPGSGVIYSNFLSPHAKQAMMENKPSSGGGEEYAPRADNIYANLLFEKDNFDDLPPPPPDVLSNTAGDEYLNNSADEVPPPPSPVSSSYSELRRATDGVFNSGGGGSNNKKSSDEMATAKSVHYAEQNGGKLKPSSAGGGGSRQTYMNMNYGNDYIGYGTAMPQQNNQAPNSDYYGYGSGSQSSSTYESIYEPINPRSPSQLSSRSNYQLYAPYVNGSQLQDTGTLSHSSSANISLLGQSGANTPVYPPPGGGATNPRGSSNSSSNKQQKEAEVEALTDFLVHSLDNNQDMDNYGICYKCNERVLGENSGCTAMDQIYHIACFTCSQCQINLQGKPFYALDGKPYCEYDYLQTLEKCSVCMKPILERILRATGKPYHPQCFTCVVCGNSLDGIPFTVDATNQNYCIADFHKKFAPRCCVCKEPIMPEPGEEETVRVVALDRSFHFECYKCEDCGLLLSSEAEGRGCYPLDDHVLCKNCNAKRVQMLTSRMTTEL